MDDPFALLFHDTRRRGKDTKAFFLACLLGVKSSPDAAQAFARFKIKSVEVKKRSATPEHEFILITASDVGDLKDRVDRVFVLERTVDPAKDKDKPDVDQFVAHEGSKSILDSVFQTVSSIPPTIAVAGDAVVAGPALSGLSAAAVASAAAPLSLASTLLPSSDLPQSDSITEPFAHSISDHSTLSIVQCFRYLYELAASRHASKSLDKPPKDAPADDVWLVGVKAESPEYTTARRARSFEALNLNLFHIALLAQVVHTEYPLYSFFKNNCYWFTNIIYLSARVVDKTLEYRFDHPEDPDDTRDVDDHFFLPYMPDVAGHWIGFKICEVQKIVVNHIVRLFLRQLAEYEAMVI